MWGEVAALLREGCAQALFPGAALCVRTADQVLFSIAVGDAQQVAQTRPATVQTHWDLASITKVLGATPVMMRMVGSGQLPLHVPLTQWVPDAPAGVTAAHCLSHASGLPPWVPLFSTLTDQQQWGSAATRAVALRQAYTTPCVAAPGERYAYSDLGMMLLCAALEAVSGERFDALWQREMGRFCPATLHWGWPGAAATEDCPVRGRVVVGEVHDLNTAVLGGVSTHAGLFGTAEQAAGAAAWQLRAWQGTDSEGLQPEVVRQFWSHVGPGSHHLGWDGVTPGASTAGHRWPLDGVGHTGFTGGVLWVAPRQGIVAALCSNRVHPEVEGGAVPGANGPRTMAFRALRPRIFTAIVDALERCGHWSIDA